MSFAVTLWDGARIGNTKFDHRGREGPDFVEGQLKFGFETKLSALSTVTTAIRVIVGIEGRGEFAGALQSEKLATAVMAG
jgi:hypothetical protein